MSNPPLPLTTDDLARMIMLTYGPMQDGQGSFWCYVAVRPSQYQRFLETKKAGKLNMQTFKEEGFGEVVVSGTGVFPPAEVTQKVAKLFDIPIQDLFGDMNPETVISTKIAHMLKQQNDDK